MKTVRPQSKTINYHAETSASAIYDSSTAMASKSMNSCNSNSVSDSSNSYNSYSRNCNRLDELQNTPELPAPEWV